MASSCQILKVVPQGTLLKEHSRSQPPEYLEAHPDIKRVWFDYSTMPQRNNSSMPQRDDRILEEKAEYQLMLALRHLCPVPDRAHLDGSYASRFWTLTEAWCSMQTVTPDGLRPATEAERRYTIKCIHNATIETTAEGGGGGAAGHGRGGTQGGRTVWMRIAYCVLRIAYCCVLRIAYSSVSSHPDYNKRNGRG
jgi:hypothetical protein